MPLKNSNLANTVNYKVEGRQDNLPLVLMVELMWALGVQEHQWIRIQANKLWCCQQGNFKRLRRVAIVWLVNLQETIIMEGRFFKLRGIRLTILQLQLLINQESRLLVVTIILRSLGIANYHIEDLGIFLKRILNRCKSLHLHQLLIQLIIKVEVKVIGLILRQIQDSRQLLGRVRVVWQVQLIVHKVQVWGWKRH